MKLLSLRINKFILTAILLAPHATFGMGNSHTLSSPNESKSTVAWVTFGSPIKNIRVPSNESKVAWTTFGSPMKNTHIPSNESKVAWVTFGSQMK